VVARIDWPKMTSSSITKSTVPSKTANLQSIKDDQIQSEFRGSGSSITWDRNKWNRRSTLLPDKIADALAGEVEEDEEEDEEETLEDNSPVKLSSDKRDRPGRRFAGIGSGILEKDVFLLEVVRDGKLGFAILIIYASLIASIVLEYTFFNDNFTEQIPIAVLTNAPTGSRTICHTQPDGSCKPFSALTVDQAVLLSNTIVVSDGINATDWDGDGARPDSPPFTATDISNVSFIADSSVLVKSANPDLLPFWDDIVAVLWLGYDFTHVFSNFTQPTFSIQLEQIDGEDWPTDLDDISFPVSIESYSCVLGGENFCESVGNWRKFINTNINTDPTREISRNIFRTGLISFEYFVSNLLLERNAWRFVLRDDPAGILTECLKESKCIASLVAEGVRSKAFAKTWVLFVLFAIYFIFFGSWIYLLWRRRGGMRVWKSENSWLFFIGVGYLLNVNIFQVGLFLSRLYGDSFVFSQRRFGAASIISHFGFVITLFGASCFIDAPRRYVTTRFDFYIWKVVYALLIFTAELVPFLFFYPELSGADEPGTDTRLGGVGYETSPLLWTGRNQAINLSFFIISIVLGILGGMWYIWKSFFHLRLLDSLPYGPIRHTQLSFRFFFWSMGLFVLVSLAETIREIVRAFTMTVDFLADNSFGDTVRLDKSITSDAFTDVASILFFFVLIVIQQILFLPPSEANIRSKPTLYHVYSDEELHYKAVRQSRSTHLMVLEKALLLCICSKEAYLPIDEEEFLLQKRASNKKQVDKLKTAESVPQSLESAQKPSASKMGSLCDIETVGTGTGTTIPLSDPTQHSDEQKTTQAVSQNLDVAEEASAGKIASAEESLGDIKEKYTSVTGHTASLSAKNSHHDGQKTTQNVSKSSELADEAVRSSEGSLGDIEEAGNSDSDPPVAPSTKEPLHKEASQIRLAGDELSRYDPNTGLSTGETTWAEGCRVVARIRERGNVDIHDTRVIIFRHEPSSDLIVSFRGTLTATQARTDLMLSKVTVCLDDFLMTPSKYNSRNKEQKTASIVEDMLISGGIDNVKLLDLIPKSTEKLPSYLEGAHKSTDDISGKGRIHFGFWSSYNRVRRDLHIKIREELIARPGNLICTGHSLGGSQATLCAYDMCRWVLPTVKHHIQHQLGGNKEMLNKFQLSCYTFGAPKVGDLVFAAAYNRVVPNTQRIVNDGDFITSGPLTIMNYFHVRREHVFDSTGTVRVEPGLVERKFLLKKRNKTSPHRISNYLSVIKKSFHPRMSEEAFLDHIREEYGYKKKNQLKQNSLTEDV